MNYLERYLEMSWRATMIWDDTTGDSHKHCSQLRFHLRSHDATTVAAVVVHAVESATSSSSSATVTQYHPATNDQAAVVVATTTEKAHKQSANSKSLLPDTLTCFPEVEADPFHFFHEIWCRLIVVYLVCYFSRSLTKRVARSSLLPLLRLPEFHCSLGLRKAKMCACA